ncbi:MAG: pitrilysin family protein [Bacteroidota bacterium]
MKILQFIILLSISASAFAQEKNILPYPIHQKKLANGLNVVTVPYGSPGIAAFYIVMHVGSRDEIEAGHSGFAHFFEHMMFRGTEKYPPVKYNEILKGSGASANANTSLDRTVYHITGNAAMLETLFDLESDRFMNLKYSLQQFKTEAGAVKGEYTKNSSSPYTQLNEKIADVAFDKHTYKHTTMGFFKDIVDMPNQYEYSKQFFQRFYRPENATILVVGDVTPEQVNALSEKYFGKWERGNYVSKIDVEPVQTEQRSTHIQVPGFPPAVTLDFKGPAYSDQNNDMQAIDLLNAILFSEKSDLYNKLVVKESKVRSMDGSANNTVDPYLIEISASLVKKEDMQYVKDEFMKAIDYAKTNPVDAQQLADVKMRLRYGFAMGIDSPSRIAEALAGYIWVTNNPESINIAYRQYEKVTAADIMRVAAKYYVTSALTIGTISDDANSPVK